MVMAAESKMASVKGQGIAATLQEVLDRAVSGMRYAASECDKIMPEDFWVARTDAHGNTLVEPNKWYQLEVECRGEVERLAGLMAKLDIGDRLVKVEEAKTALMVSAVRDAAREAGLDGSQVRALGAALRNRLEQAEAA